MGDYHDGLKAPRKVFLPLIFSQRCQFHLQLNNQAYLPKRDMKRKVLWKFRNIFNDPNLPEAERFLTISITDYKNESPLLSEGMDKNLRKDFTVFNFPNKYQKRLRTSNSSQRLNKEAKRRPLSGGLLSKKLFRFLGKWK